MVKRAERTALIVVGAMVMASAAHAAPAMAPKVVLHVSDHVTVAADILDRAKETTARVYARAGVTLEWTDGWAVLAPPDGALHLDVIVMAEHMPGYHESSPTAFAKASRGARRAYVYFGRVLAHARATFTDPSRVLALVLAHELGHLLLPHEGHSTSGLMRADWAGPLFDVPPLSRSEAAAIRARLTAAR